MKKENGITLVSLVVTIILMLILSGVVLSYAIGENGIIKNSQKATEDTYKAESMEQIQEAWGMVLGKYQDKLYLLDANSSDLTDKEKAEQKNLDVSEYLYTYLRNYADEVSFYKNFEELEKDINLTIGNVNDLADKTGKSKDYIRKIKNVRIIAYKIKGTNNDIPLAFYIYNDTKIYDIDEFVNQVKKENIK